jgi:hypothetical protein
MAAILGVLIGILAIIFGEFDDSPGLQGLGMLLIIFIFLRIYKGWKRDTQE